MQLTLQNALNTSLCKVHNFNTKAKYEMTGDIRWIITLLSSFLERNSKIA